MMYLGVNPPQKCQIKGEPITTVFVDGATKQGRWAYMCTTCHAEVGVGLGMGRGTKYIKQSDSRWLKASKK
jgi:hypothetical protein